MKLSVETGAQRASVSQTETIKLIAAAGFDAVDFSFNTIDMEDESALDLVRECAELLRDLGLTAVQSHAPFRMREGDAFDESNPKFCAVLRSIEGAAIVGAPAIVVHAIIPKDLSRLWELNRAYYLSLLPYAVRFGVKIAVENLFYFDEDERIAGGIFSDPEEHVAFVRSLGSDVFTICLDLGHSSVVGVDPADSIRKIGKDLLGYMHVHDNDGIFDLHEIPTFGIIDWQRVTSALADIGYEGNISYELIGCLRRAEPEDVPGLLGEAERIGRHLIGMIEEKGR